MTEFGVIYEEADDGGWWASASDLPVFAAGDTREKAEREIRSAIAFHLACLRRDGEAIPRLESSVGTVTV